MALAHFLQQVSITADPNQPAKEINNIIVGFLRMHPGKEVQILREVQTEIEKALPQFEKHQAGNAS